MSEKVVNGQTACDQPASEKAANERAANEKGKTEKAFSKEALLNSARWSETDRLLLRRVLKDGGIYTRDQAAAQLKKIKAKVVG